MNNNTHTSRRSTMRSFTLKLETSMKTTLSTIVAALLFGVMGIGFASDAQAQIPAPVQSGPVALSGGTIHTMAGDTIENGTILFENGVITAIGTDVELPEGTVMENVTGKHIYPGLIDAWSNMGIFEIGAVNMTVDVNEQGPVNPNVMVERAFNPESRHIGIARSAGILTSVTTPGGGLVSGQSAAMKMDGWAWDEMTLRSGVGLVINWPGSSNQNRYAEQIRELRSAFADARSYMNARRAMENGDAPHHNFDSRWEAMIPVLEGERPVVVNANQVRQIQDAITWAEEEDVRIIILGGVDSHLVANHLREKNVPVILTTVLTSPFRNWQAYDHIYSLPAKLHEAGVTFAIAGGNGAANANRLPYEAGAAVAYGLPADVALRSVMTTPATILGLDDRIGTLETGKDATLMITTGNPIEYSTQVEQVYVQGRKSDMMDMHRQFYEKYREKVDQRSMNR